MGNTKPAILRSEYAKWRESLPEDYPQVEDYRRVLLRWVAGAERYWEPDPKRPELGTCRMKSKHVHVCTARSLPVYAALAADSDCTGPVWTPQKLAERLNAALSFLCATYDASAPREGYWAKQPAPNRLRYETWVIGNMLDALQIVPDLVTPENRRRVHDILTDIIEDERVSGRARSLADYRHEGITWTINLLARAALLYPDDPRADQWLDLAKHGFASSLSVEADLTDETVIDGKAVKEWVAHRCPVFYPDFTFTHHGLGIHPGYMAIAAHRMVSLYDLMKRKGVELSPLWRHHFEDVMRVLKDLALWDGRVAFPNGKDWASYLYGVADMLYDMAGLQMMSGDPEARLLEQDLFRHREWLQLARGKGDFGPSNAEYVFNVNDAVRIGFASWIHQAHGFAQPADRAEVRCAPTRVFHSPHSKFICVRDPGRFVSWGWQAMDGRTTGLILPSGHGLGDHLAEWNDNLIPDYWTVDKLGRRRQLLASPGTRHVEAFPGGFAVSERTELHLPAPRRREGAPPGVVDRRGMVAIPDGRTVVFAASGRATRAVRGIATMDLNWRFVRSVFSDLRRTIHHDGGQQDCRDVSNVRTPWFNVDDILGVVSVGGCAQVSCELHGEVNKHGRLSGTHIGQRVRLSVCSLPPQDYEPQQEVFTACVAFVTDVDAAETRRLINAYREERVAESVRVYHIRGQDGQQYVVVVNFDDAEVEARIADAAGYRLLTPEAARAATQLGQELQLRLVPGGCALLAP